MGGILKEIFSIVLFVECAVGVTVNAFIVAVQVMKWKAVRSLDSCDQIFLCLGISRSLSLTDMFLLCLRQTYLSSTFKSIILYSASVATSFVSHFTNFWFTSILCVFYCVKIVSCNHKVFLFIKSNISRLVPWLIGVSLLISVASSIPCTWPFIYSFGENSTKVVHSNVTVSDAGLQQMLMAHFILIVLGSSIPFIIFCSAIGLLIHSLWRHTRQMRCSGTGFRNPNTEAHVAVVKNMSVFLVLQAIYFGCNVSFFLIDLPFDSPWAMFFSIIGCSPSCVHSAHMIYSNVRLNQAFRGMWHGLISCV